MRTKGVIGFGVTEKEAQFSNMDGTMWTDQAGIDGGGAVHVSDSENTGLGESCLSGF